MPARIDRPYFLSRNYLGPLVPVMENGEPVLEDGEPIYTQTLSSAIPQEDCVGRRFEYWLDKDSRDNGEDEPLAVFDALFEDLPESTNTQLMARGLNEELNAIASVAENDEEGIKALTNMWETFKSGTIRAAGLLAGPYPVLVRDFARGLEFKTGIPVPNSEAAKIVTNMEGSMDEDEYKRTIATIRGYEWFVKAVNERREAEAARKAAAIAKRQAAAREAGEEVEPAELDLSKFMASASAEEASETETETETEGTEAA